jgi:hypothetical protein
MPTTMQMLMIRISQLKTISIKIGLKGRGKTARRDRAAVEQRRELRAQRDAAVDANLQMFIDLYFCLICCHLAMSVDYLQIL